MIRSRTRVGHVAGVFRYGDEDEKRMRVQLARMSVLYDDLMLEFNGAMEDSIPPLDKTSVNARRFYFVRRTVGTLSELRQAVAVLNGNATFEKSKQWWAPEHVKRWSEAVTFFAETQKFLKDWRNDVGGHFHDSAAEFAIDNVESNAVGAIEICRRGAGADVRMELAYELVAVALVKNRDGKKQTVEEFLKEAFTFLLDATKHCIAAVHIAASYEMYDRLK